MKEKEQYSEGLDELLDVVNVEDDGSGLAVLVAEAEIFSEAGGGEEDGSPFGVGHGEDVLPEVVVVPGHQVVARGGFEAVGEYVEF